MVAVRHYGKTGARSLLMGGAAGLALGLPQQASAQQPPTQQTPAQTAPASPTEALPPGPTSAGTTPVAQNDADIVVTARKRDETLIAVPVTVSAITSATLSNRGITNLEGIARTIPNLFIGTSSGSLQGGALGPSRHQCRRR